MSASPHLRPTPSLSGGPLGTRKSPAFAASALGPGRTGLARIGKYEVEVEVGGSALIRVFQGRDPATGRRVTLKVLADVADGSRAERFRREVAAMANVRNAHVISIYELGEHVGMPFAAVEYLGGEHLGHVIATPGRLTLLEKVRVMWQVADGVQAAHRAGLSYIGLHPAGIAVCADGSAKVQDFGIVRALGDSDSEFRSYEEALGRDSSPDVLADVFSFGVIYYELLTGTHPSSLMAVGGETKARPGILIPVRHVLPECPVVLDQLVARAVDSYRESRYQNLEDLQYDAEPVLHEFERNRASALVEEARRNVKARSLDAALAEIREALELDPGNPDAQLLRNELRGLVQERTVRARLEALLCEADGELVRRGFDRATELAESASRLMGTPETTAHIQAIRARAEYGRHTVRLLDEARQSLEGKDLVSAQNQVLEVIDREPEWEEAQELADAVGAAIRRAEAESRVEQGIAKVRSLVVLESFDAAIEILAMLDRDCPGSPAVGQWLSYVETQKEQSARRKRFESQFEAGQTLIGQQKISEAVDLLQELHAEFPNETGVADLLAECWEAAQRMSTVAEAQAQCDSFCREERFDQAFAVIIAALAAYPDEPNLAALRRDVAQKHGEFLSAASSRQILLEAQWLLDQDRVDLAVQFLREKFTTMPNQPALAAKLAAVEELLAPWEKRRLTKDSLHRAAALAEERQWSVALTVLEEALEICPASGELEQAAEQLRARLKEHERQKRLAGYHADFRRAFADGEVEQAEQALQRGLAAFPQEPTLVELAEELERDKKFREQWKAAQVLVGRRQFEESETILVRLDSPERPEVQTLLRNVREARATSEEKGFYNRGREKALHLIQQGHKEQAADLLLNLLSLFPNDPILERDLQTVGGAPRRDVKPEPAVATVDPPTAAPSAMPAAARIIPFRRWTLMAGAVLFLLVSAGAAVKRIFRAAPVTPAATVRKAATVTPSGPSTLVASAPAQPVAAPAPPSRSAVVETPQPSTARPVSTQPQTAPASVRRAFNAASLSKHGDPAGFSALAPAPLIAAASGSGAEAPSLPTGIGAPLRPPALPPTRETPQPDAARANPQVAPPPALGGSLQPARPISRPAPVMPELAKERRISGVVTMQATVDKQGVVRNVKVISGNAIFVPAAQEAVKHWLYQPALLNGKPIDYDVRIEVRFEAGSR